jgi:hypothetical protein
MKENNRVASARQANPEALSGRQTGGEKNANLFR